MQYRRILYVIAFAASVALAALYAERRHFQERLDGLRQSEREIDAAKQQILEREHALGEEEARAKNQADDPVEVEAAIRQIKRGVRDGETLFRVEPSPVQPEAGPPPAASSAAVADPEPGSGPAPPAGAQP